MTGETRPGHVQRDRLRDGQTRVVAPGDGKLPNIWVGVGAGGVLSVS